MVFNKVGCPICRGCQVPLITHLFFLWRILRSTVQEAPVAYTTSQYRAYIRVITEGHLAFPSSYRWRKGAWKGGHACVARVGNYSLS